MHACTHKCRFPVRRICRCSRTACGVQQLTSGEERSERSWNRAEQERSAERKPAGGAEGWQVAAESWDALPVATNAAAANTPAHNSSNPLNPAGREERTGTKRAQFVHVAARKSVAHLLKFPSFLPSCLGIPQVRWKLYLLMRDKGSKVA